MAYQQTLSVGTVLIEEFRILGHLGSGGFANTYLAMDLTLGREVAVKEYFPSELAIRAASERVEVKSSAHGAQFEWALGRFVREAKTLAKFRHPSVVRVFRVFNANDTAYIVLEFVRGSNMETWLKGLGHLPTQAELDELLPPLLDALEVVHGAGILHRDIKPANIYIRAADHTPVLLDFGAARYASAGDNAGTTAAIVSKGYSPHEAYATDSRLQGPWTDIYGLAATIYRALSGSAPPESTLRVLEDHCVPAVDLDLPASGAYRYDFLAAIDRALAVMPKDRPQSVADWRQQLLPSASAIARKRDINDEPTTVQEWNPISDRQPGATTFDPPNRPAWSATGGGRVGRPSASAASAERFGDAVAGGSSTGSGSAQPRSGARRSTPHAVSHERSGAAASQASGVRPTGAAIVNRQSQPVGNRTFLIGVALFVAGGVALIGQWFITRKPSAPVEFAAPATNDGRGIAIDGNRREREAEAEAARKRLAAEAEKKRLAEEAEKKRLAEEAEQKRLAAEEAERRRVAEEAERQRVAAEAEKKRLAEEAEKKRLAEEAEQKRLAAEEAERRRVAEDAERQRVAAEAEKKRLADEAEKKRLADEAQQKRLAAEEAERRRLAEEADRKRAAAEAEKKRLADEAEKKRLAEEAEQKRLAAEEAERRRVAEDADRKRAAAEAEKKRLADEAEKKRLADEAERKRLAAEEAERRRFAEEAERRRAAAAEAEKKRLADEAEKKRLAEEAEQKRLAAEEAERKAKLALDRTAGDTARQKAGIEIAAASTDGAAALDTRQSPLAGNYGYDESSRRIGYLKNVQAALQSSKCYEGELTGDVDATRDALSEFEKRYSGDAMKIDVASASSSDFERWLGWFWRQRSFSCYEQADPQQARRRARELDALRRAREEQEAREERRRDREERKARSKAERSTPKKTASQPSKKSEPKSSHKPSKASSYKPSTSGAGSDLLRGGR
ncbi:MAG: protein kinase [Hyphomicrobiaceae bacterium]|nr:protein kinase [Hyphomicrobiaceae bacterium]